VVVIGKSHICYEALTAGLDSICPAGWKQTAGLDSICPAGWKHDILTSTKIPKSQYTAI
jgi:hypothetical protein